MIESDGVDKEKPTETNNCVTNDESIPSSSGLNLLENFISKETTLKAEIIWAMKLVTSHHSFNSSNDASELFQLMFPDSRIAKSVSLSASKMSYVISFGLSEYFSQILKKDIASSKFVICFDEALNKIAQKGQMDLVVMYWSNTSNLVSTRYLNSVFLGHSTAEDLVAKFREGMAEVSLGQLLQISMDGPNVNRKMSRILKEELETEFSCGLVDLGTCGLHVIHGAFQTGHRATGWNLHVIFRALYQLFKDSPARRADYITLTESTIFPLKHCEVRWLENAAVADRAVEVFENVKKYMNQTKLPKTHSIETLQKAFQNEMILPQMAFFSSVSSLLQPYLKKFQSSDPLAPFLYEDTFNVVHQLMKRFVKSEVLGLTASVEKCLSIDISDKSNLCSALKVDVGIAASRLIAKSKATDLQKRVFRQECREFLKCTTEKILERSPLSFPFAKYISSLNPKLLYANPVLCENRMNQLLGVLYEKNIVTSHAADNAKQQYSTLTKKSKTDFIDDFTNYSYQRKRLDLFYRELLSTDEDFKDLWEIIKCLLILSNGNASVESGFSINKDILVENLTERSLIAIRVVYDSVKACGGIKNVEITKDMMSHVKMARMRYHSFLDEQKKIKKNEDEKELKKREAEIQIKLLKNKKLKLAQQTENECRSLDDQISELSKKT